MGTVYKQIEFAPTWSQANHRDGRQTDSSNIRSSRDAACSAEDCVHQVFTTRPETSRQGRWGTRRLQSTVRRRMDPRRFAPIIKSNQHCRDPKPCRRRATRTFTSLHRNGEHNTVVCAIKLRVVTPCSSPQPPSGRTWLRSRGIEPHLLRLRRTID
jgi:hypothetical protein